MLECIGCNKFCADEEQRHVQKGWQYVPYGVMFRATDDIYPEFVNVNGAYCPGCTWRADRFNWEVTWRQERDQTIDEALAIDAARDAAYRARHGEKSVNYRIKSMWFQHPGCQELREWLAHQRDILPGRVIAQAARAAYDQKLFGADTRKMNEVSRKLQDVLQWANAALNDDIGSIKQFDCWEEYCTEVAERQQAMANREEPPYIHPQDRPGTRQWTARNIDERGQWEPE